MQPLRNIQEGLQPAGKNAVHAYLCSYSCNAKRHSTLGRRRACEDVTLCTHFARINKHAAGDSPTLIAMLLRAANGQTDLSAFRCPMVGENGGRGTAMP